MKFLSKLLEQLPSPQTNRPANLRFLVFVVRSESHYNPGRNPNIILRRIEQVGVDVISLKAPRN